MVSVIWVFIVYLCEYQLIHWEIDSKSYKHLLVALASRLHDRLSQLIETIFCIFPHMCKTSIHVFINISLILFNSNLKTYSVESTCPIKNNRWL